MSELQEFTCPSCGGSQLFDVSEVSPPGVWHPCEKCGEQVFVRAELGQDVADAGTAAALPPRAPSSPAAGASAGAALGEGVGVYVRTSKGELQRASLEAVGTGVADRRVLAWDLVSNDGQSFQPAYEHPELGHLFGRADLVPAVQRRCVNHEEEPPGGTCRRCGRAYCDGCVSSLMKVEPRLCPACNGPVRDPDPRLKETPPWERIRDVARFPVDGQAWKVTLGLGALWWLASLSPWTTPLYLLVLAVVVYVVLMSSKGEKRWRPESKIDGRALFEQWQPAAVLTVAVSLPFFVMPWILGTALGVFLHFPLALLAFFYYPMALGLVLLAADKRKALEPRRVLRAIVRVKESYFLSVVTLIAVTVGVIVLQAVAGFAPFIGRAAGSLALAYGVILQAHLIGWMLYMHRERILTVL